MVLFPVSSAPCTVIREPPVPGRQSVVQIGFTLGHLYNLNVPDGTAYVGKRCVIRREPVVSKRHKRLWCRVQAGISPILLSGSE